MTVGSAVVAPGASTTVTVALETQSSAPCTGIVELLTNDPRNPVAFLTVRGTVPQGVAVLPDRVLFRASKGALPALRVVVAGPPDMRLGDVLCLAGRFTPRAIAGQPNEQEARWEIELSPDPSMMGAVQDELEIHTSLPGRPLLTVPIAGRVIGDLEVRPKGLFWGFVQADQVTQRKLTVRSRSGGSFSVRGAKAGDAQVEVAGLRQSSPSNWEMMVGLRPIGSGVIDTTLTLTTDVPGEDTLEVPVYADVRAKP